jgi:hypothetical protein
MGARWAHRTRVGSERGESKAIEVEPLEERLRATRTWHESAEHHQRER